MWLIQIILIVLLATAIHAQVDNLANGEAKFAVNLYEVISSSFFFRNHVINLIGLIHNF